MTLYGSVQSGYQSGQYPARPFCLIGPSISARACSAPNCFVATDNVTAINYEVGLKGEPLDNLQMSIAVFNTEYSDLPYQVSSTTGAGFNTQSIIVDQTSRGVEWESTWAVDRQLPSLTRPWVTSTLTSTIQIQMQLLR